MMQYCQVMHVFHYICELFAVLVVRLQHVLSMQNSTAAASSIFHSSFLHEWYHS